VVGWDQRAARAIERYEDGVARLPDDPDERQRQLTRMGNSAWAAGLACLMSGRREDAAAWLREAAGRYRESWPLAPPGSWGRPIGAMKALLIAGDTEGARTAAEWALAAGAAESESAIGRYAATLAYLVLGRDDAAVDLSLTLRPRDDFPRSVADALGAIASSEKDAYATAIEALLADFEGREDFLEDVPVADTVLALQALAVPRSVQAEVTSPMLPD
jgi:hypothetical protein